MSPSQEKAGRREESEGVLAGGSDYCWRKKAARFGSVSATVFGLVEVDYGGDRWLREDEGAADRSRSVRDAAAAADGEDRLRGEALLAADRAEDEGAAGENEKEKMAG